jgi:hypothetical protein
MTCYECGLAIESPPFTIRYEDDDWPDGYLCSAQCLDDFVVVAEAEALLDGVTL